jgi:AcrR family transcriptional regulator
MAREEVAHSQRARLYRATIEAVGARGWRDTTVADVIGLAGVSRRSFYEHFVNREACFAATCDSVVARSRMLAIEAWAGERGSANRLHAGCKALLDDVAASPDHARLVLVESLAGGPRVRAAMQLAGRAFEQMLAFALDLAPRDAELRRVTSTALAGGIRHVILTRLLDGREQQLRTLTDEVLDWCEACRPRMAARVWLTSAHGRPAPARPAAVAFPGVEEERARAFISLILLIVDQGYANVTDAHVAHLAGVSTGGFHKLFPSKDRCFLALLGELGAEAMRRVERATVATQWPESAHAGIRAFLEHLLEHELLARLAFVELLQLGPGAATHLTRPIGELIRVVTAAAPEPRHGPLIAEQALAGALWGVVSCYPLHSRRSRVPWLVDQLTFLLLASYIGPEAAVEVVDVARRRPSAGGSAAP